MTLPNVTVCPPKNFPLNLNYDIMQSEQIKIGNKSREDMMEYAMDVIQDAFYEEMMSNLSKMEDPDRFNNWYHGYTEIEYPYYHYTNQFNYNIHTSATSGNISTKHFGMKFDADGMVKRIYSPIYLYVPDSVRNDYNITLMIKINKITMKQFSSKNTHCSNKGNLLNNPI